MKKNLSSAVALFLYNLDLITHDAAKSVNPSIAYISNGIKAHFKPSVACQGFSNPQRSQLHSCSHASSKTSLCSPLGRQTPDPPAKKSRFSPAR